ncbi:MAG: insulinase family protein [Lachnospiraceae bacterium]|nr:insulinase family protein [Lachnospiraceae bacterium]
MQFPEAYELVKTEELTDLNSVGYVLQHKKSGAHISIVSNDDDNKVFYIGFRTPPQDSTGVPHIIEHSVLCGSDKYPLKDPFVELVKGSMNTFLNAMTYPDKTVYPIASTNDQDFKNLMDVYLDAVFHPNIYNDKEIFMQEGWHYEMEDEDSELTINGVVYNEMKGAFSSADDIVSRAISNSLFPETAYGVESGGDPKNIPDLTYEQFLDFHRRFYHPCNSYIYLYGDMDIVERLEYLDREYLSDYSIIALDSSIKKQQAFARPAKVDIKYPIAASDDTEDATFLTYTFVISDALDQELYQAFDILEYALFSSPGAPVRKALIEKGIGKDVTGSFDTSMLQPMFSVVAKGANKEDYQTFVDTIQEELLHQVVDGIDKKSLLAGINVSQFQYREADFGSFPKGLIFGLQCLDSWLYEVNEPFVHLHGIEVLDKLREKVDEGYFEDLIQTYLLANTHALVLMAEPEKGLNTKDEEALKEKLAKYKASLSPEEIKDIVRQTRELKEHQEVASTKEELECLPMLKRSDLRREVKPIENDVKHVDGVTVLHHNIFSNGIHYLNLVFDIGKLSCEELQYAALLADLLGSISTEKYNYGEIANEVDIYTGGMNVTLHAVEKVDGDVAVNLQYRSKFLLENADKAISIMKEIMLHSKFDELSRVKELVARRRSRKESSMGPSGMLPAIRMEKSIRPHGYINELVTGWDYYNFIKNIDENFDSMQDEVVNNLTSVAHKIFRKENLMVSTIGDSRSFDQVEKYMPKILDGMYDDDITYLGRIFERKKINEGFKDASQVQYVCCGGNYKEAGYEYTGALKILKVILNYDYFWINVRVKGGAYGCRSGFTRSGSIYFLSYRDPHLKETKEIFYKTADYLENLEIDDRDMTKYIIGTISSEDTPMTPSQRGLRSLSAYLTGITEGDLQKARNEILDATPDDIRALAPMIRDTINQDYFCVVGNENVIEENAELFDEVKDLLGDN